MLIAKSPFTHLRILSMSIAVFAPARSAPSAGLLCAISTKSGPLTFMNMLQSDFPDILLVYLPFIFLNFPVDFCSPSSTCLFSENVFPFINMHPSFVAVIEAAMRICEASEPFGCPMVNGMESFSGSASACATIIIEPSMLFSFSNRGELFIPSSSSCFSHLPIALIASACWAGSIGPCISMALSL